MISNIYRPCQRSARTYISKICSVVGYAIGRARRSTAAVQTCTTPGFFRRNSHSHAQMHDFEINFSLGVFVSGVTQPTIIIQLQMCRPVSWVDGGGERLPINYAVPGGHYPPTVSGVI